MRDFFFHLQTPRGLEGSVVPVACEGPEEAFMEACRVIPQVAAEILRAGQDPMKCQFVIRNLKDGKEQRPIFGEGFTGLKNLLRYER